MRRGLRRIPVAVTLGAVMLGLTTALQPAFGAVGQPAASVTAVQAGAPAPQGTGGQSSGVPDPGKTLPSGWATATDQVATVQGDAAGLHVLVASEKSAYSWRTVATLGDPGVETTQWIGQGCVTASGRYMVVVYAPREVTNLAGAMGTLGRAAIVDLDTGAVRQLGFGYSVAYFDPGCGVGENVVLTQGGWGSDAPGQPATTGLAMINAATGKVVTSVTVAGQATSAVPYGSSIAAAYGPGITQFAATGAATVLASTPAVPFRLVPDASGGLGYQVLSGSSISLYRFAAGRASLVGTAPERSVQLVGSGGKAWLTGAKASQLTGLPSAWRAVDVPAGSVISTSGELAVTGASSGIRAGTARTDPQAALPTKITAQVLSGSRPNVSFTVPAASAGTAPLTADGTTAAGAAKARPASVSSSGAGGAAESLDARLLPAATSSTDPSTTTASPDRTCAISVDDPSVQAYQPDFKQVEWAADQAVHGDLTDTRPAGLYGSSLPSYTPQGMFSLPALSDGGTIPAQVLLGVLTQESNLRQASVHVIQGQTSNPLTSFNWFGNWVDTSGTYTEGVRIDWANADCGYGIGQVTTGMCLAQGQNGDQECEYDQPMSATDQLAVAVDYQANIAASARLLAQDWNQLAADGITMTSTSGSGSQYIEDWYLALWAYNSGLEPGTSQLGNTTGCTPGPSCTDGNGDWGLGYANNPANPVYPPDRPVFPEGSASNYTAPGGGSYSPSWDMSNPQYWTYQEKVISWAFDSITLYDYNQGASVQAFAWASGNAAYPPVGEFCTSADNCDSSGLNTTQPTVASDPCQLTGSYKDHCWWHSPATVTCSKSCGTESLTFALGAADPGDPTIASEFAEDCTLGGLPSDAVIVGEDYPGGGSCPGQTWTEATPMTWQFGSDTSTSPATYPSKIFFDQIGAGFGGHFWFSYTIPNDAFDSATGNQPLTTTAPVPGDSELEITGSWPAPSSVSGWTQIYAHIPSYGAWDPQANYQIYTGGGQAIQHRVVNQAQQANTWVSLGTFDLTSGASVSLSNVTYSGLGEDIAWNGLAYVPSSAPAYQYVALGDSYSSGQGYAPYQSDSAYSYNGMVSNCDRSVSEAYPDMIDAPGTSVPIAQEASTPGSGYAFNFLACNGQWTTQITENAADSQSAPYGKVDQAPLTNVPAWNALSLGYNELPQADQGYLTPSTNLVTMTSGGDDVRFVKVLTDCLETQFDGLQAECEDGGTISGDPQPADVYENAVVSDLTPHLEQAYAAVAADAPNAEIIVIAYPNIWAGDTNATACLGAGADTGLASWFDQLGDILRGDIETAVSWARDQGINIDMINADPAFAGHHVCDSSNWINGVTMSNGSAVVGPASFHPDQGGIQEFADLVNQCLNSTIPSADLVTGDGTCGE